MAFNIPPPSSSASSGSSGKSGGATRSGNSSPASAIFSLDAAAKAPRPTNTPAQSDTRSSANRGSLNQACGSSAQAASPTSSQSSAAPSAGDPGSSGKSTAAASGADDAPGKSAASVAASALPASAATSNDTQAGTEVADQTIQNPRGATTGSSSRGRALPRNAARAAPRQQVNAAAAQAARTDTTAADPNLNLLQLLAGSLESSDTSAASATDPISTNAGSGTDDSADPGADAAEAALASQALAASLAFTAVPPQAASATTSSDADSGDSVEATGASTGSPAQDLLALLAQKADTDASGTTSSLLTSADATAPKDAAPDASAAGAGPASAASSLAHLGISSHFAVQHARQDTNTASGELRAPVGSQAWNDELGNQLSWMTHQGIDSASLRLSPEHLGPVEVRISVQNGDASVWFGANHADTRAALEQALPRLREMFASQGLTLTDSGVSREPPRNQSRPAGSQGVAGVSAIGSTDQAVAASARITLGLVDTYA